MRLRGRGGEGSMNPFRGVRNKLSQAWFREQELSEKAAEGEEIYKEVMRRKREGTDPLTEPAELRLLTIAALAELKLRRLEEIRLN